MVNTGMYLLEPELLPLIPADTYYDITDLISNIKDKNYRIGVFPVSGHSWIDVGQWEEYKTAIKKLDLVPSNIGLVGIEKEFYNPKKKNRELVLKERLKEVSKKYDFIIIDSPPALGPITINALSSSDSVIFAKRTSTSASPETV